MCSNYIENFMTDFCISDIRKENNWKFDSGFLVYMEDSSFTTIRQRRNIFIEFHSHEEKI